jgi:hypothetical protein
MLAKIFAGRKDTSKMAVPILAWVVSKDRAPELSLSTKHPSASSTAVVARSAFIHAARQINRFCRISDFASADAATGMLHAQAFATTDISDLAHLTSTKEDEMAARTLKEAWRFMRLEQQVCEQRRPFDFYFVMKPNNRWAFPALWLVGH